MDHVSAQYSRMASTMEWYNRILTGSPRLFCRHMQSSLFKAELALPIRVLISLSHLYSCSLAPNPTA